MTNIDAQLGRKLMIDELETTNQYEVMADNAENPKVAEVIRDVADEEKVHAGEGAAIVAGADPRAEPAMKEGVNEARDIMGFEDMLRKSNEKKDKERGYPPMSNTELMRDPYRHVEMQYNDQANVNGNDGEHIENAEGCSVKAGKKNDGASGSFDKAEKLQKGSFEYMFRKANDKDFRELTEKDDDGSFTAENFDEWYNDWYGESMPKNFDWMRYHQINDAKGNPELAEYINSPSTDKFVRDWYDYVKWNNHGNEAGADELGGIYRDAAGYLKDGPDGRARFIADQEFDDEQMEIPEVKNIIGSFDTAQKAFAPKEKVEEKVEEPIQKANGVTMNRRRLNMAADLADGDDEPMYSAADDAYNAVVGPGADEARRQAYDREQIPQHHGVGGVGNAVTREKIARDVGDIVSAGKAAVDQPGGPGGTGVPHYREELARQDAYGEPTGPAGLDRSHDMMFESRLENTNPVVMLAKSMCDDGRLTVGEFNAIMKAAPPVGTKGVIIADAGRPEPLTEDDAINSAAIDTTANALVDETEKVLEMPLTPERDALEQKVWDENVPPSEEDIAGVVDQRIDEANEGKADWPKKV